LPRPVESRERVTQLGAAAKRVPIDLLALTVAVIFNIQNAHAVNVSFLDVRVLISLAVALFLAVIAGALVMAVAGTADHTAAPHHASGPGRA
jgi:uncharacterized integral membrane protein